MIIETVCSGPFQTNSYLVGCPHTKRSILIDSSLDSTDQIFEILKHHGLELESIYLTHSHLDHIADVSQVKKKLDIPIFVHREDAPNLIKPGTDGIGRPPMFFDCLGANPTGFLTEGEIRKIGLLEFKVIHTPGHSPGSVCFYFEKEKILFSGDTLFKGSIGTLSLSTAEPERMWVSLKKLEILPKETKVYPGHGKSTTLDKESWLKNAERIFG